jgi:hypothetical protein
LAPHACTAQRERTAANRDNKVAAQDADNYCMNMTSVLGFINRVRTIQDLDEVRLCFSTAANPTTSSSA